MAPIVQAALNTATPSQPTAPTVKIFDIDPRRKTNQGATMWIDRKQHWWCEKHVREGDYNGLIVTHKPECHDKMMARRNLEKIGRSNKPGTKGPPVEEKPSLAVNNDLKSTLTTGNLSALNEAIKNFESKARAQK